MFLSVVFTRLSQDDLIVEKAYDDPGMTLYEICVVRTDGVNIAPGLKAP